MRHYELVVILSPMLNQDQAAETWDRIKGFISNRNGGIIHEERWGTRRLAYPIRKGSHQFLEGSYHLTRFHTDRPFNQELETFLRLDEQVLRSLVIATEPPPPAPAVVAEPVAAETVPSEAPAEAEAEPAAEQQPVAAAEETEAPVAEQAPSTPETSTPSEEPAATVSDEEPVPTTEDASEPERGQS